MLHLEIIIKTKNIYKNENTNYQFNVIELKSEKFTYFFVFIVFDQNPRPNCTFAFLTI